MLTLNLSNHQMSIFLLGIVVITPLLSDERSWVAQNQENNMHTPTNWSPAIIPNTGDEAIFNSAQFNINTNPTETGDNFTASTIHFVNKASIFHFDFNNQTLTLDGAGITGNQTNTTINSTNTNNSSVLTNQIVFSGSDNTSGNAALHITNTACQSGSTFNHGSGVITHDQFYSLNPFSMASGGKIIVQNLGEDFTSGFGSNTTAFVGNNQLEFGSTLNALDYVSISAINSGTFKGANASGDSVAFLSESQFYAGDDVNAGDYFNFNMTNTGSNENAGTGANFIAYSGDEMTPQVQFNNHLTVRDHGTFTIINSGDNCGDQAASHNIAYFWEDQFYVGGDLKAGDYLNMTMTNTGTDTSKEFGGNNVGKIDSGDHKGEQINIHGSTTIGNKACITVTNEGTNTGTNTVSGNLVGCLAGGQVVFNEAFIALNSMSFNILNKGIDTAIGVGSDSVGVISDTQVLFNSSCNVGNDSTITICSSGKYSGSNSNHFNYVGSGKKQLAILGSFQAGNAFTLVVENSGIKTDSATGFGNDFIGYLYGSEQVNFAEACRLGNDATLKVSNHGQNLSYAVNGGAQIGSLVQGGQMKMASSFQAEDHFSMTVSNCGQDNSLGLGNNYVGASLSGSQLSVVGAFTVQDHANMMISNNGTSHSLTTGGNFIGFVQDQMTQGVDSSSSFHAGDFYTLNVINTGTDRSMGAGNNFVGFVGTHSQATFNGLFTAQDNTHIIISNSGTNSGNTGFGNHVGQIQNHQFHQINALNVRDDFNINITNSGENSCTGAGGNFVGVINTGSQMLCESTFQAGDNAVITLNNSGINSSNTTGNEIGIVRGSQFLVTGTFNAGKNLMISATNTALNGGNFSNTVGFIGGSQLLFGSSFTVDEGATLTAFNSGSVTGPQIEFDQGFNITGSATIQATNQGATLGNGILILGDNSGGNANIVLENTSLNINTTGPNFTIGQLNGDDTSIVQSSPKLIINTDSSAYAQFSGIIQDFPSEVSSLIKTGLGTQKLSGINTYTGTTVLQEGTLILTGSVIGDLFVYPSGVLKGTGIIGGNVLSSGTLAPGESIGTLQILGDFINDGGNYDLEVNGVGQCDLIHVTGTTTLNGGALYISSVDGLYHFQSIYTILKADHILGAFSEIIPTSPLLNTILSNDGKNLNLTFQSAIARAARTHNQLAVATRLDGIIDPNINQTLLLSEMVDLSLENAPEALDSLSGYQHTDEIWISQTNNRQFIKRLYDPIRSILTSAFCDAHEACDWTGWLECDGGFSHLGNNKNANGFDMNTYEVVTGLQNTFCSNWTVGIAGSYKYHDIHYIKGGSGKNDTWLLGLYGLYKPDNYYGLMNIICGYSTNGINRDIVVGPLHYTAHSQPKISQVTLYGEGGLDFNFDCLLVQPFVSIEVGEYFLNHIKEHETHGFGLFIHKKKYSTASSRLGFHLTTNHFFENLKASLDIAWNRLLSSHKNTMTGKFIQFGDSYKIKGISLSANRIDYALTISSPIFTGLTGYLEFSGESCSHFSSFNFLLGAQLNW